MQVRAEQPVEQGISRRSVLGCRRDQTAVIDGEMAFDAELGCSGGDLALAVRLHHAARHEHVRLRRDGLMQNIIKLAQLVATEAEAGSVLALHPEARPSQVCRQPFHRLERRWQLGKPQARERRQLRGESRGIFGRHVVDPKGAARLRKEPWASPHVSMHARLIPLLNELTAPEPPRIILTPWQLQATNTPTSRSSHERNRSPVPHRV
jgi:hypothetical protein